MLLDDPTMTGVTEQPTRRSVVVQKYGGSSVADVDKLGAVADRIVATYREGHDVVAVVSAMGKTTDGLLMRAREVAGGADPPRRELDMLVSTGERVSMSLLSIAIQARGVAAISFTGSQCGIITNDRHFDARIIEVRPHRIEDELARGRVVIVAGYQGMSYKREITTLGRGGTDTTAVALAAALEAERCEIYSDVDGVYSADPRVVPEAAHLPEMDYEMLQEMAHAGAKVICAQAVEWARRAGIAIYARSTFEPIAPTPRQTVVRKFGPDEVRSARAVTCDAAVAWVEAGPEVDLPGIVTAQGLPLGALTLDRAGARLLVPLANTPDWSSARAALEGAGAVVAGDCVAVSVVGASLGTGADLSEMRQALARAAATPRALLASPLRLTAVIDARHAAEAQRALHAAMVAVTS